MYRPTCVSAIVVGYLVCVNSRLPVRPTRCYNVSIMLLQCYNVTALRVLGQDSLLVLHWSSSAWWSRALWSSWQTFQSESSHSHLTFLEKILDILTVTISGRLFLQYWRVCSRCRVCCPVRGSLLRVTTILKLTLFCFYFLVPGNLMRAVEGFGLAAKSFGVVAVYSLQVYTPKCSDVRWCPYMYTRTVCQWQSEFPVGLHFNNLQNYILL